MTSPGSDLPFALPGLERRSARIRCPERWQPAEGTFEHYWQDKYGESICAGQSELRNWANQAIAASMHLQNAVRRMLPRAIKALAQPVDDATAYRKVCQLLERRLPGTQQSLRDVWKLELDLHNQFDG